MQNQWPKEKQRLFKEKYGLETEISEFIFSLISDFSASFIEEMERENNPEVIIQAIQKLVYQEVIIQWVEQLVKRSIDPILFFSIKPFSKMKEAEQIITRILLAVAQEEISPEEAKNQTVTVLKNNFSLSDEAILVIKSIVITFCQIRKKHGLAGLARIGEQAFYLMEEEQKETQFLKQPINYSKDSITNRKEIIAEWSKNLLEPASIVLKIGGEQLYNQFIRNCQTNFELFLDQTLSAEDFEKRLKDELKKFGGDNEELIQPILDIIAGSVKFLEVARIDDPSLSLLLLVNENEKEATRRACL
ncbi:MAG: hypothetical protein GF308_15335 [Candidatus Heimdallarchaeota archaeon]|nr:hypothetical protein [Candidatus Heimdallarchaeota archaeon]